MAYTLPDLLYAPDALEPHMDAETVRIHHDKHHGGYVKKLNAALEGHADLVKQPIEQLIAQAEAIPAHIRTAVLRNGGQHYNHSLYWTIMGPGKGGEPKGALAAAVKKDLGGFDAFKEKFTKAATTQFGSGWAWLYLDNGILKVGSTANHENPLMDSCALNGQPLLVIDVWEHAYYLKYRNLRPDFIAAFSNLINWDAVAENFQKAMA